MDDDDQIAKLNAIVDRFFERPPPRGLFDYIAPPFDVSKPNKHDSKAEFLREIQAVEDSIEHIEGLFC